MAEPSGHLRNEQGIAPARELKEKLYAMGTTVDIRCEADRIDVIVRGVDRNVIHSVAAMKAWLGWPAFEEGTRRALLSDVLARRNSQRQDFATISRALHAYARHDEASDYRQVPSRAALRASDVSYLRGLLIELIHTRHTTFYVGPRSVETLIPGVALGEGRFKEAPPPVQSYRPDRRIWFAHSESAKAEIRITVPGPRLSEAERAYGELYRYYLRALGFAELRVRRGLAYRVWAWSEPGERSGQQSALGFLTAAQGDKVVDIVRGAVELLTRTEIDPDLFSRAKSAAAAMYSNTRTARKYRPHAMWNLGLRGLSSDPWGEQAAAIQDYGQNEMTQLSRRIAAAAADNLLITIVGDRERIDLAALEAVAPVEEVAVE
ncbi:MAG: hypothetical protein AAGC55_32145, partial [Myxococcota bacterium]